MIGALAIKRRRKLQGNIPEPEPAPKSRHCACVYITGGASVITGIILLIPAIIESSTKLYIGSASLISCGILLIGIACCLSGDPVDDGTSDTEQEHTNRTNIPDTESDDQVLKVITTTSEEPLRRASIDSTSMPVINE